MSVFRKDTEEKKERKWKVITGIAIGAILLTMIKLTSGAGSGPVEGAVREAVNPLQAGAYRGSTGIVSFFEGLVNYKTVKEENAALKAELAQLKEENSKLENFRIENESLKGLLELKDSDTTYNYVAAEITGRSIKDWYKSLTINKGTNDGIGIDMPVVTNSGFVGRISAVTKSTAVVTLITDPDYGAISAMTEESSFPGIVVGASSGNGVLEMIQIPAAAPIMQGYKVVTSGTGDLRYRLNIGEVKSIENSADGLMKKAIIEPYETLSDLDYVFVIVGEQVGGEEAGE